MGILLIFAAKTELRMCKAYHNCTAELTSIDSTCIRRIIAVFGKI